MDQQIAGIDAILARVQKMLNVEGRTPEEAAAYVEKAHAILAQYDLTIEDVGQLKADPRTSVAKASSVATSTRGKPDGWKADLLVAVADAFECKVMRVGDHEQTKSGRYRWVTHYQLIGFKHDLDSARYAHSFLVGEITRQAKAYARTHWDAISEMAEANQWTHQEAESYYTARTGTHPLKAELYFIKGATQTITRTLVVEARARRDAAVADNPFGLVVQKAEELDDFIGREQFGDKWEEVKARRARAAAEVEERMAAEQAARSDTINEAMRETEAQARKRREREQREYERWERRYWREQDKIDHDALAAGQQAGERIKVRPGVESGEMKEAIG